MVKNTIVNDAIINKLSILNIYNVVIFKAKLKDEKPVTNEETSYTSKKDEFKENYKDNVNQVRDVFQSVLNGQEIDLEKVSSISDDIFSEVDNIYMAIESISELTDFDDYTYIHSVNVGLYSMLLAQWLKLSNDDVKDLVKAAVLHDIGKAKVDDSILNKPGQLTEDEFFQMKKHPQYGYDMCKDMMGISDSVKDAILSHHEKVDGSGYPNAIKGQDMGLFAKIIAVCDVYDAITSKRVYKDKITPFETFDEMMKYGYDKLDTDIMLTLLNNIGDLYVGMNVRMETGETGEIVFIPHDKLSQPLIKIDDQFIDFSTNKNYKIKEII